MGKKNETAREERRLFLLSGSGCVITYKVGKSYKLMLKKYMLKETMKNTRVKERGGKKGA